MRNMESPGDGHNCTIGNTILETEQLDTYIDENTVTARNFKNVFESTLFAGNNIYFLTFASIGMLVTAAVTMIRHRQQKFAAEQKELEYLRYFHSVLPHSQIYGNLTEKFFKLNKRKNSKNVFRASLKRKSDKVEDVSNTETKLNGLSSFYKQFRYSQSSLRTLSRDTDADDNGVEETELTDTQLQETSAINANGNAIPLAADESKENKTVCQKFHFNVKTDNMQDVTIEMQENDQRTKVIEKESTEGVQRQTDEIAAQKCKPDSANHRVHFCLEIDENKQEQEAILAGTGSQSPTGPLTQAVINVIDTDDDTEELIIRNMLFEEIENMKTTVL